MIFYSFENLTLIAGLLVAQTIIKFYSSLFFPLEGIAFLRLGKVSSNPLESKNGKESLQKVYMVAEEKHMKKIPEHSDFSLWLYLFLSSFLVYFMKWLFLFCKIVFSKKFEILEQEVLKQNLIAYLTIGLIFFVCSLQFFMMTSKIPLPNSDRKVAFYSSLVMIIPCFLISFNSSVLLPVDIKSGIQKMNLALQVLSPRAYEPHTYNISLENYCGCVSILLICLTYVISSSIFKNGIAIKQLIEYRDDILDTHEKLQIDPVRYINEIEDKENEIRDINWLILSFVGYYTPKLLIIVSSFHLISSQLPEACQLYLTEIHLALLIIDTVASWYGIKAELKVKYNTLGGILRQISIEKPSQEKALKLHTDYTFADSIRHSLVSSFKILLPFLVLCLFSGLYLKQVVITERQGQLSQQFQTQTILMTDPALILRRFTSSCGLSNGIDNPVVEVGFAVEDSFNFYTELVDSSISKRYSWVMTQSNFLFLETSQLVSYYLTFYCFLGSLLYLGFLLITSGRR